MFMLLIMLMVGNIPNVRSNSVTYNYDQKIIIVQAGFTIGTALSDAFHDDESIARAIGETLALKVKNCGVATSLWSTLAIFKGDRRAGHSDQFTVRTLVRGSESISKKQMIRAAKATAAGLGLAYLGTNPVSKKQAESDLNPGIINGWDCSGVPRSKCEVPTVSFMEQINAMENATTVSRRNDGGCPDNLTESILKQYYAASAKTDCLNRRVSCGGSNYNVQC
jgi:hypothetical protein